jgi:molecular chaperone DnaK
LSRNLVSFKGSERSIGEEALNQVLFFFFLFLIKKFVSVPKGTIFGVKRLLGKQVDDLQTEKKKLPYVVGKQNNKTGVEVNNIIRTSFLIQM